MQGLALVLDLQYELKYLAMKEKRFIIGDPNATPLRQRLARQALGADLYDEVESTCLKAIEISCDSIQAHISLKMLGMGLSSARAKPIVKDKIDDCFSRLEDTDPANDPNSGTLLCMAEALCYMGDESGLNVLYTLLKNKNTPTITQCVAIESLVSLGTKKAIAILAITSCNTLLSRTPKTAACALDNLKDIDEFKSQIGEIARIHLTRLARVEKAEFDRNEFKLLDYANRILRDLLNRRELAEVERQKVKEAVKSIVATKSTKDAEVVSLLFSLMATSEDSEMIGKLLNSESARLRTAGIRSLVFCEADTRKRFLPDLIRFMDDPNPYTRDLALFVIRRYKGEIVGSGLPGDAFIKERDRIKQWWQEQQGKQQGQSEKPG
jgi:HEAT repeat protein